MTTRGRRGFVTIATGSMHYYELAANLIRSYKLNSAHAYPFAIIAENENRYTAEFDEIVLMKEPAHNYLDKLRLFEYLPYEETIFIDADCLVYGNIDKWWDYFSAGDDFSFFGYAYTDLTTKRGWFLYEGMKEYKDQITFIPSGSSGICYLRNTEKCRKVFEIANYTVQHYSDYAFNVFKHPADEPVLALGMAVCGCKPTDLFEVGIFSKQNKVKTDILKPSAVQTINGKEHNVKLVHWGNPSTRRSQYLFESSRLNRFLDKGKENSAVYKVLYEKEMLRKAFFVYDIVADFNGLKRRVKRFINKK